MAHFKVSSPKTLAQRRKETQREYSFNPKQTNSYIKQLEEFEKKAKVNKNLKFAISEIKKALQNKNFRLASELSGVKSFVGGFNNFNEDLKYNKKNIFSEDSKYNEKVLGKDAYQFLDGLNFALAMKTDMLPSGMMVLGVTKEGKGVMQTRGVPKGIHPTLKLMQEEHEEIVAKAGK